MEGDGEGLVAIVQGLENSGVTLTVCNRSRHNPERSRPAGLNRIQINAVNTRPDMPAADQRRNPVPALAAPPSVSTAPAVQRTSVETSTGSDFSRMATASQICDGRYASSYKLAHCMISPTSPPEAVTEFPPQRKEPCRNQGNFEIGGHSSGQWNGHGTGHNASTHGCGPMRVPTSKVRHYGGTQTWEEKGSSHRYSKLNRRESEAFAHSLRKYPSMAPFRTASTDLIEKLIRYTQAKHYQETSRSTKSMRSLRHQRSFDSHDANRVSTQQQTYTRRRDDNTHVQASSRGRSRNFKLYSPISDNRHLKESRYRETTHSSSYDYLKAGSPPGYGRANRSDGSPSPTRSRSPEGYRSSERSRSPHRVRSPDRSVSPCGSGTIQVERPSRTERSLRFERSVRDLSLSEMSKYIRSTIRQICNERPVVVQVCPKLKDRYNQHRKVCPNRNESSRDVMEFEEEENPEDQASGSVLSRFVQSFSGRRVPPTEQTGCQCTRTDCYCNKATQCVNNPTATSRNTATCNCLNTKTGCCRGMPCVCASKSQDQAYYNKRIDEEISEWLKNVPVHSIEQSESKLRRETIVKELRKTLKQLPDDENFEENATNEIQSFVEEYPLWNPGKDERDEKLFKNQLADMLAEKIKAVPRKPDRLRDIVRKWVTNMDFEENGEEVDMEVIIDNFVNKLKTLAAERPACDVKYTNLLKKEIIELFVELALKFDGDMPKLRKMANTLATEIASIPRNVDLSGETNKLENAFEENIADWICEHGLCEELKKDPKLIKGLTKRLNKLKAQGVLDEDIREEVKQFVDDVGVAFETIDELIEDLMAHISSSIQMKETEKLDQEVLDEEQEVLDEELSDWLRSLPGASNLHLTKFEKIIKDLSKAIQENREQENENLANEIVNYLANTDLSIDPANLGEYVEELMENLGIVLSDKYHKEQAKRIMIKDIFEIIACSPIPEEKKEEMRSRAHEIVEKNLRDQLFYLSFPPDSVKETLLQSMDDMVSDIDLPTKSRLQMKSLLNTAINRNFDKSFTRLIRNRSDLKQSITNDVRNAIEELPIDQDRKNDLMQKVKETLSKNMNKPLPNNIKNNINEEICDAVERCPICEDRNVLGRIKKILSEIASKHLTIYLPNCVCDIQSEVEKDVSSIIDSSSMDFGEKRHLKGSIQEILSENEDRRLSEEVIRTIKKDIDSVVSDLSIPQDKKDILKKAVRETVSQDFNNAGQAFSHDLNKIRDKLFDDITNVIEKSPIQRDLKSHLMDKLDTVLARNLDSSISDEKANMILDDISDIVRDIMPEEKRRSLTNKLAEKLGTHQSEEETDELTKMINRLSIDSIVKDDMKKEIKAMLLKTLYNPLSVDVRQQILEDFLNEIDEIDIQEHEKKKLKSNITQAIKKEFNKLSTQNKEVPEIKDAIEKIIKNEIKNVPISKHKEELLAKKLKDVLTENLDQAVTDEVKETIKERLEDIVNDHITDEDKADAIKIQLRKVDSKEFVKSAQTRPRLKIRESSWEKMQTKNLKERDKIVNKTQDYILSDMEQAVDEASIPREKKNELKNKLKNMVVKNFKKPLENVADGLKDDINVILDELNFTNDEKNKLSRELTAAVDKNMNDLVKKYIDTEYSDTQRRLSANDKYKTFEKRRMPIEEFDETKVKDKKFQEIDEIIEESGVPEEKQMELKRKLKKIAAENFTKPFSEDAQEATNNEITEIINDLPISKTEKTQLKSALTNIIYDNVDSFRGKKVKDKPLHNIFKDTERAIEEAPIPREKKTELKKKLEKLTNKDFNEIPLENIPDELKDGMTEIIDELNLPRNKKNKLKSALNTATDEYISNMQPATRDKYTEFSDQQRRPGIDSRHKKIDTGLKPAEVVDAAKIKGSVLPGIEKIIEDSTVPKEKKMELKRKLNTVVAENLKKPLHEDVQDSTRKGIAEVIKDLPIPISEKNKLKTALTSMVDENMDNLRGSTQKLSTRDKNLKKVKDKPLQDIFQDTEQAIEDAPIPREKKTELKKKLKKLINKDFNEIPLENIPEELIDGTIEIINELNLPKDKKNKLKQAVTTATDEYMSNMQTAASSEYIESPDQPLQNIFLDTERAIEDAPIPREKKTQLKKKLKKLTKQDFNEIPLENIPEELIDGMTEIIDELNLPKDKKNKLKSALNTATDDYISNMQTATRDKYTEFSDQQRRPGVDSRYKKIDAGLKLAEVVDAAKIKGSVLPGIEKIIEDSTVPKEKKMELKRKLNTVVAENLKKPLHEDVQDSTRKGIAEVIKDLPIPISEKNKLKTALTSMVDKNMDNLRGATQKLSTRDKNLTKVKDKPLQDIFQDMEQAIEDAPIPREKKTELKKKLKKLINKDFNEIPLENIPEEIIDGTNEIINELNLPKDKKNKLKQAVTTATDEYMSNMQTAASSEYIEFPDQPLQDIFLDTEQAIKEAHIPREKKAELIKKLKKLTNKDFNEILLENVPEEIIHGMIEIIDELNLPRDKKNKLKSALNTATDEYISNMQTAARDKYTEYSDQKGSPSLDSRYKKNYISPKPIDVVDTAKVKDTILQGIDKITEDSNVPKEKKKELKRKLKTMANENMKKPFSIDVEDTVKNGITKIVDDVPMPKTERNKLKSALTNMVDDNMGNLRGGTQKVITQDDKFIKVDDKPLQDIFQQTERAIEEASLPREKRNELKKKMKTLTNKDFNKIPFEDVAKPPKSDMIEIIDDMNLPKDKKNKLKSAVTTATDEYMSNMRTAARNKYTDLKPVEVIDAAKVKDTILQGIDTITEDSNVPKEKKMELKRKLKTMANENLEKRFSEDVVDTIKDGIAKIVDDVPMPKTERNKLKFALKNLVDDKVDNLRGATQKLTTQDDKFIKVDDKPLHDIFQQTQRAIEEAPLPRVKKNELKKKLENLTNKDFHKIPLEDVTKPPTDDILEIIDELNLPKDKKINLKRALTTATDEYMSNVRTAARNKYNEYPDQPLREIFKEIERAIEEAPLSREKKNELKKKLKKLSNPDFNKIPLDDVAKPSTDDMIEIIDELNLPKDKKINLKSGLTTATDEYMSNVRTAARNKYNEYPDQPLREIFKEIERAIEEAPLSREKKNELKKKLKKLCNTDFNKIPLDDVAKPPTDDILEIIDELNLPKDRKNNLKSAVTTAKDEYMNNVRTAARNKYNEYPDQPLRESFKEMEQAIEESTLPREKKNELKKKMKKLTNKDYNKIPLEDVAEDNMNEIIDEMNLPKDKKNKLKSALTTAVDEYKSNMQTDKRKRPGVDTKYKKIDASLKPIEIVDAAKVKNTIMQEIEKITENSTVPKEKKIELKRKLKNITAENLKKPFSKDMQDTTKNGIAEIIDELPISKTEKNKLNNALTSMLDENIPQEINDTSLHNIYKYMKRAIEEAPLYKQKKDALKKKLLDQATKDFNNKSLKEGAEELKIDLIDIIDELNLPKDKKNNLKNVVFDMIDKNTNILQSQLYESPSQVDHSKEPEDRTQRNILQGFDEVIDEASIPWEINMELKKKLKDIATKNFKKPWSDDVAEDLKDDINKILDETNLPNDKKNNLKNELTAVVNENTSYPKYESKPSKASHYQKKEAKSSAPRFVIDEKNVKGSMKEEVKKSIQRSEIGDADKSKLNFQLLKMISGMLAEFDEALDERMKQIFDKYGITPSYWKTLLEEYNKLLDIILKGGDLEPARRKLIEKLMRDLNLSEEVATALVDELIALAQEMAQKEGIDDILEAGENVIEEPTEDGDYKYSIDPSYIKILEKKLSDIKTLEKNKKPVKAVDKIQQPKQSPMEYKEQNTSERRRRDQAPSNIKGSAALSTGNINYSLKELIATNKSVRKQWSKHLDDAIIKLPLLRKENNDLKNKLAIYDETGQINILSDLSRSREETNPVERDFKSITQVAPKPALKNNKGKLPPRLSKIEEAFAFNNTTRQKSPFTPNAKQDADMTDFTSNLKETINTWLKKAQVEIEPNEKNRILEELAKDIIYRQKYIQTFGAKPSQTENLEYMKLQVYRRLNGMVPIETLKQTIENTKELVAQIDNVRTPPLVVSPAPTKTKIDQRPSPSTKTKDDQRAPSPTIPQIAQQKRNSIVFKKPPSPTQRKLGPADILGIHAKATNTTTADGVLHTVDDDDGVEDESDTEFSPGQASTPAKPINYIDKATDAVTSWLESMPIDMEPEMRMEVINDIVSDIVDRQKYLQAHPEKKYSDKDEIENLRFQVFKRLDKIFEPGSSATPSLAKIEELYRMINGDGQRKSLTAKQAQEFQTALNLEISGILNDYNICCDKRELLPSLANELIKLRNSGTDQDEIVENLIDTINRLTYLRGDPAEELAYKLLYRTKKLIAAIRGDVSVKRRDFKDAVMNDVGDVFQGSPMSEAKRRMMENQLAEGYAKDLGIPLEDSYATMSSPDNATSGSESKKERYGMSFNGLSNFIDSWLSSIPDDDSKDEDEIMDMKKQRMYCLMHKIGEMNVDPEIFNDDSLYEAVLREELQHLFGDVSMNDEEFKALKEDLIEKVLESQRRAHDELAGQNYKNNLRDTISKLLPDQRNLSKEDQATMETLKDQLADAYIDLHYSGNNESQRDKLKRKISNEINTFCRDYLNRNPCSPLNSQKLNHDLYAALSKVPLPAGDSIKYEVEQARIREEINDWVKELPLQPQNPTELLARNKLIYVLSKKLFDIELDEEEEDTDELMRKKIVTFLNKLPLESDDDNETIADTLIDKLKASEKSRKYSASANVTIDAFGMVSAANSESGMKAPTYPGYKPLFEKRKPCGFPKVCRRPFHRPSEAFPPCTLNPEDRDHLDRIRRRTCLSPNCVTSLMRNKCPLRIGPAPIDARSQTEEPQQNRICPFAYEKTNRPCPRVSANLPHQPCPQGKTETCEIEKSYPGSLCRAAFGKTPRTCPGPSKPTHQSCQMRRHTISSTNVSDYTGEVQPKILIKQYYWDPLNNNSVDLSDVQQSGRSSRRQSDSLPSPSPRPAPCASPRLGTFRPTTCSPPRPASCTSSRPPPCRPPPSYSSRPPPSHQSLPCETQSSCPQSTPGPCRRPSSGKLKQHNTSPQPKSPRQNSSERYSYYDPLNTFQRSSHRDILSFRSPCAPSPCMSPLGIGQCSPPGSPGFSKRFNECRMPKKDGLQDQVPSNSSRPSQKERVIELGSLDDVGSTRPKKRHSDQSDWPKFHEDDNFWAAPMRRVILDEGIDESLVMERERREERVSCRCKERLVPKCGRSQPATVPNQPCSQSSEEGQNLKRCSKCCGIHCPYPSFLYFRQ